MTKFRNELSDKTFCSTELLASSSLTDVQITFPLFAPTNHPLRLLIMFLSTHKQPLSNMIKTFTPSPSIHRSGDGHSLIKYSLIGRYALHGIKPSTLSSLITNNPLDVMDQLFLVIKKKKMKPIIIPLYFILRPLFSCCLFY